MAQGTSAYYKVADPRVHQLCELVCGQMAQRFANQAQMLGAAREQPRRRASRP
jgi:hypothetical protein